MRKFIAAVSAACLLTTTALADTATVGPLAPGKPAGVKKADLEDPILLIVLSVGIIAIIAAAAADGGSTMGTSPPAPVGASSGTS